MHLQKNTVFDIDLGVKVTRDVAQYPLHHVTYAPTKFEVATSRRWEVSRFICHKKISDNVFLLLFFVCLFLVLNFFYRIPMVYFKEN